VSPPITINETNNTVTVTNPAANTVTVAQTVNTLTVSAPGPQGATGATGPQGPAGDGGYDHTQGSAAATWTIAHNLGYRPTVSTLTVGGVEMEGMVTHLSVNTLTIDFTVAVAGTAHLV